MRLPFRKLPDDDLPDAEVVARLAAQHLPADVRERWTAQLRPAVRLVLTPDPDLAVARLGGLPRLPAGVAWPHWEGHGPLSFVGELRCDRLSAYELDVPVPNSGRLLFFYFDGSYDDGETVVGAWDPATLAGARALHVLDDGAPGAEVVPEGLTPYPERLLAGRTVVTAPEWEDDEDLYDELVEALHERHDGPVHQVGGYADAAQGPVEHEVAEAALGGDVSYEDPRLEAEARRWRLLLQVDSDDEVGMAWGDSGILYWLARPEDLERGDVSQVSFTWQSH